MGNTTSEAMRAVKRNLAWDIGFASVLLAALCAVSFLTGGRKAVVVGGALLPLAGYLLLCGLERCLPTAGPRKSARRWWMHLHINLANMLIGVPVAGFFGAYLASVVAKHLGIELGLIDLRLHKSYGMIGLLLSAGILSAFTMDFFYYWYHRAMHKSAVLWQHHKMHHLDPEFDALTGIRFHWMEYVLFGIAIALPLAILFKTDEVLPIGIANWVILCVLMMSRHINHSNLRIQFGKASVLWVSSQTHRIHHSRLPEHHDKNFVAFVPIWDVIFGTYYAPRWNEFPPTGVEGESEIKSFWEAQIFTFREWWKMFRTWQFRHKDVPALHTEWSRDFSTRARD